MRSDCTTRNKAKAARLQSQIDELEQRILDLAKSDAAAAERPEMDGQAIMDHLDMPPGPLVGKAVTHLLEIKRTEGALGDEAIRARLDAWWATQA